MNNRGERVGEVRSAAGIMSFMLEGVKMMASGWLISAIGLVGTLLLLTNRIFPAMFLLLMFGSRMRGAARPASSPGVVRYIGRVPRPILCARRRMPERPCHRRSIPRACVCRRNGRLLPEQARPAAPLSLAPAPGCLCRTAPIHCGRDRGRRRDCHDLRGSSLSLR
jgi:hypothetical protein